MTFDLTMYGEAYCSFAVTIGFAVAASVCADDNVRAVQEKLRDGGFYTGEIDGAYSSELAAALTRYQVRKGLAVTGQLPVDTSKALDARPAVTKDTTASEQSSETWRRLRERDRQATTSAQRSETAATEAREASSPRTDEKIASATGVAPQESPHGSAPVASGNTKPASSPPATENTKPVSAPTAPLSDAGSSGDGDISTERLRDYVGAFVLAGLDPHVGSEADFFADRVKYYDQGVVDREKIRNDLQDYAARWPERHFWFGGNIIIEPQHRKRVRVTFPLRYELRNGTTYSSGTINKTLVLEPVGDDLQIVAVSESKAD